MGWMRALFLGDIGNQLDIVDNRRDLDSVRSSIRAADTTQRLIDAEQSGQIESLRAEVDELRLALSAISRLLVSKRVLREQDLAGLVAKLDQ